MIDARACKFQIKEKLMFIPRGRAVPYLKISRISSLFRWMSVITGAQLNTTNLGVGQSVV